MDYTVLLTTRYTPPGVTIPTHFHIAHAPDARTAVVMAKQTAALLCKEHDPLMDVADFHTFAVFEGTHTPVTIDTLRAMDEAMANLKQGKVGEPIRFPKFCECMFCLNTGPNGECEHCGLPPSPERLNG
jgi:hypothetical protein